MSLIVAKSKILYHVTLIDHNLKLKTFPTIAIKKFNIRAYKMYKNPLI